MNNNDIEDFYPIHIGNELKKLKNLEEITKEEFDRVLKEGEELKDILLQNPEIAELESAKDKIYRSMFDMSDEKYYTIKYKNKKGSYNLPFFISLNS